MHQEPLLTVRTLARAAQRHRSVVLRMIDRGEIRPAAFVDLDGRLQPLFPPSAVAAILARLNGTAPINNVPTVTAGDPQ